MTPHEKAIIAIKARLERLQANLREAKGETAQQFLLQSIVATIAVAEALSDYIKQVGNYAQRRHEEWKRTSEGLAAQHAGLLKSGQELLERLKVNPADHAIRKEIERTQQNMVSIQRTLRREANGLQRELAPSMATIDEMSLSVRRHCEADQSDGLKRLLKTVVAQVRKLYATQPALPARDIIDAKTWEESALSEVDRGSGFDDTYARAGNQLTIALEMMILAVSENPPHNAEEAIQRANESVSARLKEITARLTAM